MSLIDNIPSVLGYIFYMALVMFSYKFNWRKWNWFAISSFTIILGFRGNGIDYFGYKALFDHLVSLDASLFDPKFFAADYHWSTQSFEWFYLVVIKLIKNLGLSSVAFFSVIAFAQIFFFDLLTQHFKKKNIKMLLVFFFFTTLMFVESFNVMRQMIAILAYTCIIPYLAERNFKKYFFFCSLLYLVHTSSIVLIPLYFLNKDFFKNENIQFAIYFIAVIFSFFFKEKIGIAFNFVFTMFSHMDNRMLGYLDMSKESIVHQSEYSFKFSTFVFRTIGISYLILNGRKLKNAYGNYGIFLFNMVFIGFIVQEFIFGINIQRLNYYFYYLSFIVFSLIADICLQTKQHKTMFAFTRVITIMYLLWFINSVLNGAAGCAPYSLSKVI